MEGEVKLRLEFLVKRNPVVYMQGGGAQIIVNPIKEIINIYQETHKGWNYKDDCPNFIQPFSSCGQIN